MRQVLLLFPQESGRLVLLVRVEREMLGTLEIPVVQETLETQVLVGLEGLLALQPIQLTKVYQVDMGVQIITPLGLAQLVLVARLVQLVILGVVETLVKVLLL
jgi:hypothetical protein